MGIKTELLAKLYPLQLDNNLKLIKIK